MAETWWRDLRSDSICVRLLFDLFAVPPSLTTAACLRVLRVSVRVQSVVICVICEASNQKCSVQRDGARELLVCHIRDIFRWFTLIVVLHKTSSSVRSHVCDISGDSSSVLQCTS